ncbi:hypothetical protein [Sphingobium sp. YBL2]|uniref:hypothetical protein n=1 Tax=Sphingobium sp. (strain YBL2) TaxID=484429 RepID=UPI0005CC668F|nr:hypothetical protein [Sphingobium sp. YBL2]AJR23110.1 hypothetical protein TZ53_04345 [Sphingobium sp. YBL2]
MWGGRFNPIIPIDDPTEARALIDLFRVDCLYAATKSEEAAAFIESQAHLPWPDYQRRFVIDRGHIGKTSTFADLLAPTRMLFEEHYKNNPQADPLIVLHEWSEEDPLADILLATFGGLPPTEESAHDYSGLIQQYLRAPLHKLAPDMPIELPGMAQMSLASFNRLAMEQHYAVRSNHYQPGFYVGNAADFDDLVSYWNLRATDIPLIFYDPAHEGRLDHLRDQWLGRVAPPAGSQPSPAWRHGIAIWSRSDPRTLELTGFGEQKMFCSVNPVIWNGLNVRAPIMVFGSESVLASVDDAKEPPTIAFMIPNSPLKDNGGLSDQQYVVSVDPGIGLLGNERFTLHPPFLPHLNEFYGRNGVVHWNKARAEPGALGIVVGGSAHDLTIRAIETRELFEKIFKSVGISATPSPAGLVCDRLVRQMGGVDGCRVFRIGGVRDLIESYPPERSFTTSAAKQAIRAEGSNHPLSNYESLYIEPRRSGARLTNDAVLAHLLRKEVFRPGLKLDCPSCRLEFWRSLDDVRTNADCEYCGHLFHVGPQLRNRDWAYRRSGLFGRNDNQQGALPVILTLLQLHHLHEPTSFAMSTAMSLEPNGSDIRKCETDFVFLVNRGRDHRIQVAIGECKTRHAITEDDVQNLLRVAKAFPTDRFDVFLIFSKMADFSEEEAKWIAAANDEYVRRAIMLTPRELDSWHPYERAAELFDIDRTIIDLEGMANATHRIFFEKAPRPSQPLTDPANKGNQTVGSYAPQIDPGAT